MPRGETASFGSLLRALRLRADLSQEELAARARLGSDTIGKLERGRRNYPNAETVARLADALGVDPADRVRLDAAARRPRRPRRGRAESPAEPVVAAPRGNVIADATPVIGRGVVLAEASALLATRRLVTLVGAAGVGKTKIARHLGARPALVYADGVWMIELAPVADPALVLETMANVLGVRPAADTSLRDAFIEHVRGRTMLLIVDNCEHLIAQAAELLDGLLRASEGLRILATSREPLRIPGEWTYRVPSLQLPPADAGRDVKMLRGIESIALFVERAASAAHGFTLDDGSGPFVAEICRRLDGIPLAIELAAARVGTLGVADIAELLEQRFRILNAGGRAAPARHQTMRAAIEWSFDLLTPGERRLFERIACFAGSWSLEAATFVCAFGVLDAVDVLDLLTSLVDKSMIAMDVDANRARYRLLESNRAFALERLSAGGDGPLVERRLAYWVAEFADRSRAALHRVPRAAWLPAMEEELENARAALKWALDNGGDTDAAVKILTAYRSYWFDRGYVSEGLRWLARLADVVAEAPDTVHEAALWQTKSVLTTGKHAVEAALEAIERLERLGDLENLALATMRLAVGYRQMANFREAKTAIERALEIFRRAGLTESFLFASALSWRASALIGLGAYREAREAFAESIRLDDELGDSERAAVERLNLAELEFADDNVEAALSHTEATLEALRDRNNAAVVVSHLNAAAYRIVLGNYGTAQRFAEEGLRLARSAQNRLWIAVAMQHLATLIALRGNRTRAALLLGYVERCYAAEGSAREPTEVRTLEILERQLAVALTATQRAELENAGATLNDDEALEFALDVRVS